MKKLILLLLSSLPLLTLSAMKDDIYPKAEKEIVKHIIILEEKEENYLIKLKFGREKLLDCNNYFLLGGKIEEKIAGKKLK